MPSKTELKDREFNDRLLSMKRFTFEYGGYFSGFLRRTYTVSDDTVLVESKHTLYSEQAGSILFDPIPKEEFIREIADLHIGEWKRNYIDAFVDDGTQWSIDIEYEGSIRRVHFEGCNAFPYNFDDLLFLLDIEE